MKTATFHMKTAAFHTKDQQLPAMVRPMFEAVSENVFATTPKVWFQESILCTN